MKYSNIRVLVGRTIKAVDDRQCDDVRECDTVAEAKKFARYSLTEEYREAAIFSEPMGYARVMATEADGRDVCLEDYVRRRHVEPEEAE